MNQPPAAGPQPSAQTFAALESYSNYHVIRLHSVDDTNRLTRACLDQFIKLIDGLNEYARPLIVCGNHRFFSAGADLNEIARLGGSDAYAFSRAGQRLMNLIDGFPALTIAAISGFCFGGGLDLALACDLRIAAPNVVFGHRGASLGVITGWGGTQRLPRLIGKGRALQMFCAAEKIDAHAALQIGLVNQVADDPVAAATQIQNSKFKIQSEYAAKSSTATLSTRPSNFEF